MQPTCAIPTGTIVVTAPTGVDLEYSIDGTTYQDGLTFAGLTPADYTVNVRDKNDTTCVSVGAAITIEAIPALPIVPTLDTVIQPTCAVQSGTITFNTQADAAYSVDGTTFQVSEVFAGLAPGVYTLEVRSTIDNTCTTTGADVTINAIPTAPAAATASVTVQPTCLLNTGTIVITAPTGVDLEYSVDGTTFQDGTTFAGLAAADYTVTIRKKSDNTCSSTSVTYTVDPVPGAPAVPTASATVQPTCAVPTGTIVVTAPTGVDLEYSVDGTTFQDGTTFAGLTPADYTVSVRDKNDTTCVSVGTPITIEAVPAVPTISITTAPTCAADKLTYSVSVDVSAGSVTSTDGTVTDNGANNWTIDNIIAGTDITLMVINNTCENTLDITAPNCKPLSTDDEVLAAGLSIYPNPVSNVLYLKSKISIDKIEIYSALGQKVKLIESKFDTINLSNLAQGTYWIRVYSEKGSTIQKLIKK